MQDINFIAETVKAMCKDVESTETIKKIVNSANQYANLRKFPVDKSQWSDEQLDMYFNYIEKIVEMPTEFTQGDFEDMNIEDKLTAVGIETSNMEPGIQQAGDMLGGVVKKMEAQNKYRDDLKCPCPNQLMVWDNRRSKRSDKSPDFTCSGKTPEECPMHTGKWRKSWWLDNSDIPKEWNLEGESNDS